MWLVGSLIEYRLRQHRGAKEARDRLIRGVEEWLGLWG